MSTNVESIYQSALLADAAYVSLNEAGFLEGDRIREDAFLGSLNDDAQSFSERGFSREEFDAFRLRYRVLQHQPDSMNGFSATLFEDTTTGQLHLAFRGTNDLADVFMDLGLAVDEAYRYEGLLQNGSVTDFLKTAGILDDWGSVRPEFAGRVHVVGHSLGGYLATWSAFRHPEMVSSVDTFNGAGLVYGTPLAMFLNTLWGDDLPQPGFDRSRITHYFAEPGPELTAAGAIAFRPGRRVPLFIENQSGEPGNILDNHSMAHLVDALGAYRLLARLDPTLELGEITGILEAASNRGEGSLA
ncbi:MAG: alpha/beta hydrolase-fold protein, partial [Gammaproteobacteria bacterium]